MRPGRRKEGRNKGQHGISADGFLCQILFLTLLCVRCECLPQGKEERRGDRQTHTLLPHQAFHFGLAVSPSCRLLATATATAAAAVSCGSDLHPHRLLLLCHHRSAALLVGVGEGGRVSREREEVNRSLQRHNYCRKIFQIDNMCTRKLEIGLEH